MRADRMITRTIPTIVAVAALLTGAVAFAISATAVPGPPIDVPNEISTGRPLSATVDPSETLSDPDETAPIVSSSPTESPAPPSDTEEREPEEPETLDSPSASDRRPAITDDDDEDREVVSPPTRENDDDDPDDDDHEERDQPEDEDDSEPEDD